MWSTKECAISTTKHCDHIHCWRTQRISYVKQAVINETKDDVVEENKGEDIHIDLNESVVEKQNFQNLLVSMPLLYRES